MLPTPLLNTAVAINATACFLIGITLNTMLLWLILKRSPASLRTYSRVLLQSAVTNMVCLTATVLYSPVQLASAKGSLTYGVGWLVRADNDIDGTRTWNFTLHSVWVYTVFFSQLSVIVFFLFRYFAVCHGRMLTGLEYGMILTVAAVAASFYLPYYFFCGANYVVPSPALLAELGLLHSTATNFSEAIASLVLPNTMSAVYVTAQASICGASYFIVIACNVAIYCHLRRALTSSQVGISHIQGRQINFILLIDAVVPFVFDFLPTYVVTAMAQLLRGQVTPQTPTAVLMVVVWAPVVNAASVILVVRPYRRAVLGAKVGSENTRAVNTVSSANNNGILLR